MPGETTNTTQTFTFETVAVLVAVIKDKGGNLGMKDYELMASLDSSRSASGFDHLFRKVKNRANELLEAKNGGVAPVTTPKKKGGAASKNGTPATGEGTGGKKRGRKAKKTGEDADDDESPTKKVKAGPDGEDSPTKKVKAEADEDAFDQVEEDGDEF